MKPEAAFLVMLGASSFPARHEVYGKTIRTSCLGGNELVPNFAKNTVTKDVLNDQLGVTL